MKRDGKGLRVAHEKICEGNIIKATPHKYFEKVKGSSQGMASQEDTVKGNLWSTEPARAGNDLLQGLP